MHPEYIVPEQLSGIDGLVALQTTRKGGVSPAPFLSLNLGRNTGDRPENVRENTLRLCRSLGIYPEQLAGSDQVHGTEVLHVREPGFHKGYDALVTSACAVYLCIFTADCFPVLLFDPKNRAVAAVHAGWKGTAGGIVMKTIAFMRQLFGTDPAGLVAWIGTGISQAEYEVDAAVAGQFPAADRLQADQDGKKFFLDLAAANSAQLAEAGVPATHTGRSPFCASRDKDMFYSYRRDAGLTGRMASIIGLTSPRQRLDRPL